MSSLSLAISSAPDETHRWIGQELHPKLCSIPVENTIDVFLAPSFTLKKEKVKHFVARKMKRRRSCVVSYLTDYRRRRGENGVGCVVHSCREEMKAHMRS